MNLRFTRLDERALLPTRAHASDAGLDLYALQETVLGPGERSAVRTGVAVAIPPGHAGLVVPRSGLAARHGISVVNAPGLIDSDYRGELQVLLLNTDRAASFTVEVGTRVAQLVIIRVALAVPVEVNELADTARGAGGFGSSGR